MFTKGKKAAMGRCSFFVLLTSCLLTNPIFFSFSFLNPLFLFLLPTPKRTGTARRRAAMRNNDRQLQVRLGPRPLFICRQDDPRPALQAASLAVQARVRSFSRRKETDFFCFFLRSATRAGGTLQFPWSTQEAMKAGAATPWAPGHQELQREPFTQAGQATGFLPGPRPVAIPLGRCPAQPRDQYSGDTAGGQCSNPFSLLPWLNSVKGRGPSSSKARGTALCCNQRP